MEGLLMEGRIYKTKRYGLFKFANGNRPVKTSGAAWNRLRDSMLEKGQLEPALVTKDFVIINGQHRFEVCKQHNIPFRFTISDKNISAENIADANNARKWGSTDYIHFYASQTDARSLNYKYLQALMSEFNLSSDVLSAICVMRAGSASECANRLADGTFILSEQTYENVRRALRELYDYGIYDWNKENKRIRRSFWLSMVYAQKHPRINIERLAKLMVAYPEKVPSTSVMRDMLRSLSNLYNKGRPIEKKVYLDIDWEQKKYRDWED